MVGDRVEFEVTEPDAGWIVRVYPRSNRLVRPPVANVAGVFVVFSLVQPAGNLELVDKRLVMAALTGLQAELVITKVDLDTGSLSHQQVEGQTSVALSNQEIARVYRNAGYRVWLVSGRRQDGIQEWLSYRREGIWVLTGESGVGKSTLLKCALPQAPVAIQELSRIGRGQQTTRWVRLYRVHQFWLADSPGYTALSLAVRDPRRIRDAFGEFAQWRCRFADCLHGDEPGCAVVSQVNQGRIAPWRYRHYRELLQQWVTPY
jgi:ribosome biogenesis GTPase